VEASSEQFHVYFYAPDGSDLTSGFYSDARRYPAATQAGMRVNDCIVDGRGSFTVKQIEFHDNGTPAKVWITFEQYCDWNSEPLIGEFRLAADPPIEVTSPAHIETRLRQLLVFPVSAIATNGDAVSITASNLPMGASFDSSTEQFQWVPATNQAGLYEIVFIATSSSGAIEAIPTLVIVRADPPLNDEYTQATKVQSLPFFDQLDTSEATWRDVWYTFTSEGSFPVIVSSTGSDYSPDIIVFRTEPEFRPSNILGFFYGTARFHAVAGEKYIIQVRQTFQPILNGPVLRLRIEAIPDVLSVMIWKSRLFRQVTANGAGTLRTNSFGANIALNWGSSATLASLRGPNDRMFDLTRESPYPDIVTQQCVPTHRAHFQSIEKLKQIPVVELHVVRLAQYSMEWRDQAVIASAGGIVSVIRERNAFVYR